MIIRYIPVFLMILLCSCGVTNQEMSITNKTIEENISYKIISLAEDRSCSLPWKSDDLVSEQVNHGAYNEDYDRKDFFQKLGVRFLDGKHNWLSAENDCVYLKSTSTGNIYSVKYFHDANHASAVYYITNLDNKSVLGYLKDLGTFNDNTQKFEPLVDSNEHGVKVNYAEHGNTNKEMDLIFKKYLRDTNVNLYKRKSKISENWSK